jgi:hypothetical protein
LKSGAKTHRTPKALRAKFSERLFRFREALGVGTSLASLLLTRAVMLSEAKHPDPFRFGGNLQIVPGILRSAQNDITCRVVVDSHPQHLR